MCRFINLSRGQMGRKIRETAVYGGTKIIYLVVIYYNLA